jgi:phosphatidylserine decarboxylase
MSVCREGFPFILGCLIPGGVLLIAGGLMGLSVLVWIAGFAFLAAAYCAYFFRDPARIIPPGEKWILSPADGKILEAVQAQDNGSPVWLVRIFLSVFDPHLQRAPIKGRIKAIRYQKGKFLDARNPKAHVENEQNRMEIESPSGMISVTQIAGLIARRIVCWAKEGESLAAGQQYGLIRFGSQVDLTFPATAKLLVKAGDRVEAGSTILAELA